MVEKWLTVSEVKSAKVDVKAGFEAVRSTRHNDHFCSWNETMAANKDQANFHIQVSALWPCSRVVGRV